MNKKIKSITTIILAILLCTTIQAQEKQYWAIGISSGYTLNTIDATSGYYNNRNYQSQGGFSVSIPIEYNFNKWFAIRTELSYMTKNHSWDRASGLQTIDYEKNTNSFVQLPIIAKFSVNYKKWSAIFNVGGYVGLWTAAHREGAFTPLWSDSKFVYTDEKYKFDSRRDNRFDAGLLLGAGIEYNITNNIKCFTEARILYGLTDMQKQYQLAQFHKYNTTLLFQVGVIYKFNKKGL